MKSIIK
ncbi:hypothetical protein E2320_000847, partial [Naja naja]